MLKSKLIQLLRLLSEKEKEKFASFIKDNNFNKHNKVIELYSFIQGNFANANQLEKKKVFTHLFPNEKYKDLKLRHLMSYLLKLLEDFGYLRVKKNNKYDSVYKQLSYYHHLEFGKGVNEVSLSYQHIESSNKIETSAESYTKYNIYTMLYNHAVKSNRMETELLTRLNRSLDDFYILSKLKVACSIVNQQTLFNQTIDNDFFKEILVFAERSSLINPMIALYYHIYFMIKQNEIDFYKLAKRSFDQCIIIEDKDEVKDALLLLINFCIRQINQGNRVFEEQVFEHYKTGISYGILLDKQKLSPFTYSNTINIALKRGELEWVNTFAEKYRHDLDTEYPEDFYALNKSKILLASKQYSDALDFINRSSIQDLLTQLQLRVVQIKIFVELDEYQLAATFIDNFRQMLKRKNILAYHKTNFKNIAKYILKYIKLAPYAKDAKQKLRLAIESEKVLTEKVWLLEKLD